MKPIIYQNEATYQTGYIDLSREEWETVSTGINRTNMISPEVISPFPFRECIPSWNLVCGPNGWAEISLRGRNGKGWTDWYPMALWASGDGPVRRSSLKGMEDERGSVKTDVLCFKEEMDAVQMKIGLTEIRRGGLPLFKGASLTWSSEKPARDPAYPMMTAENLPAVAVEGIPAHSQMLYADGGRGWCSPTSVSMVLAYWRQVSVNPEAAVREAVAGVFDPVYGGTGNWSFNTAWAGSLGYYAYLSRFARFSQTIPFLEADIPLIISIAFNREEGKPLKGAPMDSSAGHLILLKGFDGKGGALVHDPAASTIEDVPRIYDAGELETRWLESSGGLCYVIRPESIGDPFTRRS